MCVCMFMCVCACVCVMVSFVYLGLYSHMFLYILLTYITILDHFLPWILRGFSLNPRTLQFGYCSRELTLTSFSVPWILGQQAGYQAYVHAGDPNSGSLCYFYYLGCDLPMTSLRNYSLYKICIYILLLIDHINYSFLRFPNVYLYLAQSSFVFCIPTCFICETPLPYVVPDNAYSVHLYNHFSKGVLKNIWK